MDTVLLAVDTIYGLIFLVAAVLAALQTQRDLVLARSLIIIGASFMALRWITWALVTEATWPARGLVGALIGAALFVLVPSSVHWVSDRIKQQTPPETKPPESTPSSMVLGLLVECSILGNEPIIVPPEGLRSVDMDKNPNDGQGMSISGEAGKPFMLYRDVQPFAAIRCSISNYDNVPILSASMNLRFVFRKDMRGPRYGSAPGDTTLERSWNIRTPKIDPMGQSPMIFYIFNRANEDWGQVIFPKEAIVQRLGEANTKTVPITVAPTSNVLAIRPDPRPRYPG